MNELISSLKKLDPKLAIVNINYRYVNGNTILIQDQIDDIAKAVKFLNDNASKFQIGNKISMVGASAGAHLAMMYAYKYDISNQIKSVGNYFGPTRLDSEEWYRSFNLGLIKPNVDVLFPLFGTTWNAALYSAYSPYAIVTAATAKPTISFHGGLDPTVPKDHSKDIDVKLKQLNIPSEYHEYPLSLHVLSQNDLKDTYPKLINFINKHW